MGQQMAQGDGALCRAQPGLTGLIKAFQHAKRADTRHQRACRCIQGKLARFHQHHRRRAGNGLGHGGYPEHGIGLHEFRTSKRPAAKTGIPATAMPVTQSQHQAGNGPRLNRLLHPNCDILLPVHACHFPCHSAALPACSSPKRGHVFIVPRLETRR